MFYDLEVGRCFIIDSKPKIVSGCAFEKRILTGMKMNVGFLINPGPD
jgi:hypothetical protein